MNILVLIKLGITTAFFIKQYDVDFFKITIDFEKL